VSLKLKVINYVKEYGNWIATRHFVPPPIQGIIKSEQARGSVQDVREE
jgi:hypothetical protein